MGIFGTQQKNAELVKKMQSLQADDLFGLSRRNKKNPRSKSGGGFHIIRVMSEFTTIDKQPPLSTKSQSKKSWH